ncbi:MAG: imidazole glycerol phosphate synthase subunit HisH, partial [Bdellovibrionota bacterium]
ALNTSGMLEAIKKQVLVNKIPLLGICVGYQMLTKKSEEGQLQGLGWLEAETLKFQDDSRQMKIPHMGWNYIKPVGEHPLANAFLEKSRAYFVHSYYVKAKSAKDIILETEYIQNFASGMAYQNIMGVQFHPEKSHKFGMQLFKSFVELSQ